MLASRRYICDPLTNSFMTSSLSNPLLRRPLADLGFSDDFQFMAGQNGYMTIADILKEPLSEFPMKPGSGFRFLKELLTFLAQHDLAEVIED